MLPDIKPLDLLISSDMGSSSRARDWPRRTDKKTNFVSFQLQPWAYPRTIPIFHGRPVRRFAYG
jgi:hypothetical protein